MTAGFRHKRQVQKLCAILDQEYLALLGGRFDRLDQTLKRTDALVDALERAIETDPGEGDPVVDELRSKADRNARVILSSLAGIKAAQRRVDDIRKAVNGLDTYTGQGRKVSLTDQVATTEKRS